MPGPRDGLGGSLLIFLLIFYWFCQGFSWYVCLLYLIHSIIMAAVGAHSQGSGNSAWVTRMLELINSHQITVMEAIEDLWSPEWGGRLRMPMWRGRSGRSKA